MKSTHAQNLEVIEKWNQFIVDCAIEHELPVGVVYEIAVSTLNLQHQLSNDHD